jgi:hypothetical protein
MRLVSVDNGRVWEWMHEQRRFRAVWLNGSPVVRLYFRSVEDDEADWVISHSRPPGGNSAKSVAEQMYRDITGLEPDSTDNDLAGITARLRIRKTWYCDAGPHDGLFGVELAPLYLTRDELAALQAAQRSEGRNQYP